MSSNADYLEKLKRAGHQKSKQFEYGVWGVITSTVAVIAILCATDTWMRMAFVVLLVACVYYFFLTSPSSTPQTTRVLAGDTRREAARQPTVTVMNATTSSAAQNVARLLSPNKNKSASKQTNGQQSSDWNENFDPQSPQRIVQAVVLEKQVELNNVKAMGPNGTGLLAAPSLYPNANMNYPNKASISNLSCQFSGNTYGSPSGATNNVYNRPAVYPTSQYAQEPAAPVWHAYHSSPPQDMPSSSGYGRSPSKYRAAGGLAGAGSAAEEEETDPLREMVGRVAAEMRGADATTLGSPTFSRSGMDGARSSPFRTPSAAGRRGFLSSRKGSLVGAGLTEDRLEHVLGKYLESQEAIVQEASNEILRQLAERASRGALPLVQNQEDLNRIKLVLLLQSDRQVLQNRSSVSWSDIVNYCRSTGISEELLRRYEAAVAVLQSPNHGYSNRGTPAGPAGGSSAGYGAGMGSSSSSGLAGASSGLLSASKGWGTPGAHVSYSATLDQSDASNGFNSVRRTRRR